MIKFDFTKTPITQIADYIIISAAKSNASDIHFDPREDGMMIRFRVDGDLQNFTYIPKTYERNLTTRLKLLANMNITESRLPQDGAIKGNFGGTYLDMRVSCLPLNEGEKIVIRILDYSRSLQGLDFLGFNESNLARLKRMIQVPNGIILITGATGSGKSTTVYSILQALNKEETNIITVEDPIEMNIEGMNQVQVNAEIGMTFAAALRSILRQDPNVILIGEIRDSETAQIAVRAAITGHLVLSTIHTNNTLSTVERLLDMNVERYLLSTALTGIISQRLAKKICTKCRVERETSRFEKKVFKKYLKKDIEKVWDANPDGCDACRKGYKGRVAIQEVLELDDEMRNALNNENLSKDDLSKLVYSDKVITMLQDALGKVVDGTTSFEEVLRVIEIEDAQDFFENNGEQEKEEQTKPEAEKQEEKKEDKQVEKQEQPKPQEEKEVQPTQQQQQPKTTEQQQTKPTEQQETNAKVSKPNLEEITLNPIEKKTTTQTTPRVIPTTIDKDYPTQLKTTTSNKPINTLEKLQTLEEKKEQPTHVPKIPIKPNPTSTTISNLTSQKLQQEQPKPEPKKETKPEPQPETQTEKQKQAETQPAQQKKVEETNKTIEEPTKSEQLEQEKQQKVELPITKEETKTEPQPETQPEKQTETQEQQVTSPPINEKITNPIELPSGQINNNIKPELQPADQLQQIQEQIRKQQEQMKQQQEQIKQQQEQEQKQEKEEQPPQPPIPLVKITPS